MKQNQHFNQEHPAAPFGTLRRALFGAFAAVAFLNVGHSAIQPPDEMVAGKSQAEWNASGWKRAYEFPLDGAHPIQDRTGASALRNRYISVPADIILDVVAWKPGSTRRTNTG